MIILARYFLTVIVCEYVFCAAMMLAAMMLAAMMVRRDNARRDDVFHKKALAFSLRSLPALHVYLLALRSSAARSRAHSLTTLYVAACFARRLLKQRAFIRLARSLVVVGADSLTRHSKKTHRFFLAPRLARSLSLGRAFIHSLPQPGAAAWADGYGLIPFRSFNLLPRYPAPPKL